MNIWKQEFCATKVCEKERSDKEGDKWHAWHVSSDVFRTNIPNRCRLFQTLYYLFHVNLFVTMCYHFKKKNQIRMNVFCVSVVHFLYFMFPMRRAIQSNSLDKFWCLMITIIITTTKNCVVSLSKFFAVLKIELNWNDAQFVSEIYKRYCIYSQL